MKGPTEHVLLRAYLLRADRPPHVPTYQLIVRAAWDAGLLGVTVLPGILGTGRRGEARPSFWSMAERGPVVVEVLDGRERIVAFVQGPLFELMAGAGGGTVTLERAAVVHVRHPDDVPADGGDAGPTPLAPRVRPLSTVPTGRDLRLGSHMAIDENGVLLRVFVSESDRTDDGRPVYEAIVAKVRELGLGGATVLRGSEGFGAHSVMHRSAVLAMNADLPVVVEVADAEPRVAELLPHVRAMLRGGTITMEYVAILRFPHAPQPEKQLPEHPDAMA